MKEKFTIKLKGRTFVKLKTVTLYLRHHRGIKRKK